MDELKPCPFCGKPVELVVRQIHQEAYIVCSDHNCLGAMDIHWGTEDDPIKFIQQLKDNWNRRAEPENKPDIDRLNGLLDDIVLARLNPDEVIARANKLKDALTDLRRAAQENNPLTLQQLRKMVGQPVWVEPIKSHPARITPRWHGIERVADDRIVFSDCIFWLSGLNKTYNAYARKPEGSEKP